MSDGNLIPITDEQAKLGKDIVGAGRDFGGTRSIALSTTRADLKIVEAGGSLRDVQELA